MNVVGLPCSQRATQPSQVISDTQYDYDGGSNGATPTAGNLTKLQQATAATGGLGLFYTYTTEQASTYDQYGRVLTSTDADNRKTTTAYTPATGAEPTSVAVTDPATLLTTTTYDPARDLPTGVTDPAGYQSAETYDALGRVTAQWTPGNPATGPAVDKYTYTVSATAPTVDTEQAEQPGGGYLTSETLYDSLGQVRETQQATAGGGTDVTDTSYNSDGWKALVSDPYYTSGAPSGTLVAAAPRQRARRRPGTCTTATGGSPSRSRTRSAPRPGRPTPPTAGTTSPSSRRRAARRRRRSLTAGA